MYLLSGTSSMVKDEKEKGKADCGFANLHPRA